MCAIICSKILYEEKFWRGIKIGDFADAYKIAKLKSCHIYIISSISNI